MLFEARNESGAQPPFTFEDLLESRIIKGFHYRELWPTRCWQGEGDLLTTNPTYKAEYNRLHQYMAWHGRVQEDNHQTFLVELKRMVEWPNYQRLYVMFHDWSILVGETARRDGSWDELNTKSF